MHARLRLPLVPAAALLLAGTPFALAQSPLPDPVAPAVIGRPLDELGPVRPARPRSVPAKPAAARPVAAKPSAAPAQQPAATQRVATPAAEPRAAPQMPPAEVGQGTHFARKPAAEGTYFGERHRSAARKYYAENPVMRPAVRWKIGEPVPRDAVVALVPRGLLAVLPEAPAGHHYVELGGEVVLIAAASRMVVDGISRDRGETALLAR